MTRREFFDALLDAAGHDERIWLLTADLGHGLIEEFEKWHPDRFVNCGCREQAMVGIAAGLAKEGKIPFCYSHANFLVYRALEFIRNDVVLPQVPVRFIAVGYDGAYPDAGPTHHHDLWRTLDIAGVLEDVLIIVPPEWEGDFAVLVAEDAPYLIALK